jgi:hypothetical protein
MTTVLERIRKDPARERRTEAYEVRAFRDESEQPASMEVVSLPATPRPDTGAIQAAKDRVPGHGEQRVLPDEWQFRDTDLCNIGV